MATGNVQVVIKVVRTPEFKLWMQRLRFDAAIDAILRKRS